ncbi:hypothetical protein JCM1840_007129 [Sporobolomyces johnsonii]
MKLSLALSSLLLLGAASLIASRPFPLEGLDLGSASDLVSRALGKSKKDDIIVVVDDDRRGRKKHKNKNKGGAGGGGN